MRLHNHARIAARNALDTESGELLESSEQVRAADQCGRTAAPSRRVPPVTLTLASARETRACEDGHRRQFDLSLQTQHAAMRNLWNAFRQRADCALARSRGITLTCLLPHPSPFRQTPIFVASCVAHKIMQCMLSPSQLPHRVNCCAAGCDGSPAWRRATTN